MYTKCIVCVLITTVVLCISTHLFATNGADFGSIIRSYNELAAIYVAESNNEVCIDYTAFDEPYTLVIGDFQATECFGTCDKVAVDIGSTDSVKDAFNTFIEGSRKRYHIIVVIMLNDVRDFGLVKARERLANFQAHIADILQEKYSSKMMCICVVDPAHLVTFLNDDENTIDNVHIKDEATYRKLFSRVHYIESTQIGDTP